MRDRDEGTPLDGSSRTATQGLKQTGLESPALS